MFALGTLYLPHIQGCLGRRRGEGGSLPLLRKAAQHLWLFRDMDDGGENHLGRFGLERPFETSAIGNDLAVVLGEMVFAGGGRSVRVDLGGLVGEL